MSLPAFNPQTHLFGLQAAHEEVFEKDNRYRLLAERIYPLLVRARPPLESCYVSNNGRPAIEPVLLLGVSVLQFLEKVPDRAAVEQLKYHLGWKFALNVELGEKGFDPTVLVRFRERLVEHEQGRVAFEAVLSGLREAGLMARQNKQRIDSTHVLGAVSRMSTLDRARETLRLALEEIAEAVEEEKRPAEWAVWWERYVEESLDYRCSEETLKAKLKQAGEDLRQLNAWVGQQAEAVKNGEKASLLERVFEENFEVVEGAVAQRRATRAGAVHNPHDPEAQWCTKQQNNAAKEWVGYKVQVAETVEEAEPQAGEPTRSFLTSVVTQPATESDEAGMEQTLEEQAEMGVDKPQVLFTDGSYLSGELLTKWEAEGREWIGPAQPSAQTGKSQFKSDAFEVCVEERRAICPAGQESTQSSRLEEGKSGKVSYRFEWSWRCTSCALRAVCVPPDQKHRTLVVGEYHTALQRRRREMKTEAFEQRKKHRNAIEGTHSELVRGHGMRRARYRGLKKVQLQNYFIGAACNVKRWIRRVQWEMKQAIPAAPTVLESS
jgi:transposase